MAFQAVKGMRDFYPDEMRVRNWIIDTWRRVSLRNGFEEFDSPILEYLDLFTAKSGEGIAGELFNLTDRGGRNLAIRPEMTPSLARMVNAKINSLPRPIKWFCSPQLCRAEKPQKGRTREFFQWNVDIIGEDSVLADAESVFVAVDALREFGLSPADVVVRYSSRALLSELLRGLGVPDDRAPKVMTVIDKRGGLPADVFAHMLGEAVPDNAAQAAIVRYLDLSSGGGDATPAAIAESLLATGHTGEAGGVSLSPAAAAALGDLEEFQKALAGFGVADWCRFDTRIIRGLAYYTGIVWEVYDAAESLRAVAGGGRYDNLLEALGGPKVGACGFGMGDVVLGILLEEKGKLPAGLRQGSIDAFVIAEKDEAVPELLRTVSALRGRGVAADFSYKRQTVGKQLQAANRRGARFAVIVHGDGRLGIKDLATGQQTDVPAQDFLAEPKRHMT